MAYITIDVDIDEFYDDDLIEELKNRGYTVEKTKTKFPKHREKECLLHTLSIVASTATNSAPTWRT